MLINNVVKWAWVAGLLDGEGCFKKKKSRKYITFNIVCNSTDKDVLSRLTLLCGGTLKGPYKDNRKAHYKPHWTWGLYRRDDVINTIEHIYYFLCQRRRNKCDKLIKAYEEYTGNKVNLIDYDPILAKLKPKELELVHNAYCAGIIEGEGSIDIRRGRFPRVRFASTDKDIITRFYEYIGKLGKVSGASERLDRLPIWSWRVSSKRECSLVIEKIKPFLLSRRRTSCILAEKCHRKIKGRLSPKNVQEIKDRIPNCTGRGDLTKLAKQYGVALESILHYREKLKNNAD